MIYGYIRVSTDKQTVENQRFEINNFCSKEKIIIDRWIEETISGTKEVDKRQLGKLLKKLKKGDVLICAELSRLGRSLLMIMSILHHCMKNEIQVWTLKDNFRLGNDIQSQVLAFAFGLSAQIERELISLRTKEGLARKRAEGVILGRPVGSKNRAIKLTGMEAKVKGYLDAGLSYSAIGRLIGAHRLTVATFVNDHILNRNVVGSNDMDIDPLTAKQLSKLIENKDVVIHLLGKKKSILSISKLYKVEPFVVSIFRTKFKNYAPNNEAIINYENKTKVEENTKREIEILKRQEETVKMLIGNGHSNEAVALFFNISSVSVSKFKNL